MKGDLEAAQECLAALWPLLNLAQQMAVEFGATAVANVLAMAKTQATPLYLQAMGDDVPEPKPTAK